GNFEWPLIIKSTDATNINFVARTIPQVSVSLSTNTVSEAAESSVMIEFARTGSTAESLAITFGLSGTAQPNRDYSGFLVPTATFPAGVSKIQLPLQIFNDSSPEEPETVTIEVIRPGSEKRDRGQTNEYTVYYPGWELRTILGTELWFQTDPAYMA